MQREQWTQELRHVAVELRPRHDSARLSMLNLASKLGVRVRLIGGRTEGQGPIGRLRIGSPPIIELLRVTSKSFSRNLNSNDEGVLSSRDRFTIAHELGHWLAYAKLGVHPPSFLSDKSRYWRMEQEINRFAGQLLVPDWQAERWLARECSRDVHVARLLEWSRDCRASPEVVATRVSMLRNGVGFLKLAAKDHRPFAAYKVIFSTFAEDISLPQQNKIVCNERLAIALGGSLIGDRKFSGFRFDPKQKVPSNLYCSWANHQLSGVQDKTGEPGLAALGSARYWTSWGNKGFSGMPEAAMNELPL